MNMKVLNNILRDVSIHTIIGDDKILIKKIAFDSNKCEKDTLFFAVKGSALDGHKFIDHAILLGSTSVVCEELPIQLKSNVTYIKVFDARKALGIVSSNFFDHPSKKIKIVGITGTNGKTTIATLLFNLFRGLGYSCGLISTIENRINDIVLPSKSTTPDTLKINELLIQMVLNDCKVCFMEVSSHGIKQQRISGINFSFAVFTNISRDHLDYHKNLEDYILTKKKFFDDLSQDSIAVINKDDKYGGKMVSNCKSKKIFYSIDSEKSHHKVEILKNTFSGLEIKIDGQFLTTSIIGFFNAYNLLAIYAIAIRIHEVEEDVLIGLEKLENILGRLNVIKSKNSIYAIIDYAHSPGAVKNIFKSILSIKKPSQKIITVIGCGGNRDTGKRPIMGSISYNNSDITIFTADNPRDEGIMKIINEMSQGLKTKKSKKLFKIEDRRKAINEAIQLATTNDIVLILGKGHEKYQEIKGEKFPFDDYKVLENVLK